GVESPLVTFISSTSISCATPAHALGTVDVTITAASLSAPLTLAGAYTYVNNPPTATLSVSPPSGPAPLTVAFDCANSVDSDGTLIKRIIDFGDGTPPYTFPVDLTNTMLSHTYNANGTFTVLLVVTDDKGASSSTSQTIV